MRELIETRNRLTKSEMTMSLTRRWDIERDGKGWRGGKIWKKDKVRSLREREWVGGERKGGRDAE